MQFVLYTVISLYPQLIDGAGAVCFPVVRLSRFNYKSTVRRSTAFLRPNTHAQTVSK